MDGLCKCEKRKFSSRKDAKAAARRAHPGAQLTPYRCEGGYWHYGHLPSSVKAGSSTRSEIWTSSINPRLHPHGKMTASVIAPDRLGVKVSFGLHLFLTPGEEPETGVYQLRCYSCRRGVRVYTDHLRCLRCAKEFPGTVDKLWFPAEDEEETLEVLADWASYSVPAYKDPHPFALALYPSLRDLSEMVAGVWTHEEDKSVIEPVLQDLAAEYSGFLP